ncbi:hypothetical protein HanXRQr2_Chr02g0077871 [Helianthus annuus]|uniref:Uncharacterized protein n=1 Tax=Helianthus annuus TaxID=4232 RepID=A0A9K3JPL3_HELAN|nr:hypothetical protein HanXRQr2_Chr02g0077871 [Helianthus annuus]KAJ0952724.1 hypothetical protein HanPSC8_Chr02g0075651 [Helianthus annuus]
MINRGQLLKKNVSLETSVGAFLLSRVSYTIHLRSYLKRDCLPKSFEQSTIVLQQPA